MTPAMGYTEMKDSGIPWMGTIPEHWDIQRAKFHFTQTNTRGNDTPILLAASQKYGVCPQSWLEGVVQVSENTDLQQFKTVHKNDFVISLRSFQGGFERSDFEGVCSPAYQVFHADDSFNNDYLKYLFKNELFIDEMNSLTVGIREGRNIKYDDFANSLIFIPPLEEQSSIAAYLDIQCAKIDEVIAEAKASIEDYKKWKASIIYEAVTKGLDPDVEMKESGTVWLGEIPSDWAISKIGSLYTQRNEKVSDKDYPPLSVTMKGILPQLDTAAKTEDGDNRKLVKIGDFAINSRSDRRGSCGISPYDGSVSLINTILTPRNAMHPGYYNWLFHTSLFADEFYKWGHGIVDDLWTTRWQEMKKIIVPVPSYNIQEQISVYLDAKCAKIDELITEKQTLISDLESYKKSLIYEVVTGKRRVC